MMSSSVLIFLVVSCVTARIEERGSPSQIINGDPVLQKLIAAPGGDYTVTATGSVQWKETITVKSIKSEDETAEIESYFYEECCSIPYSQTYNDTMKQCIKEVEEGLGGVFNDGKSGSRLIVLNCVLQCVSHRLGLSERSGFIKPEQMVNYVWNDSRTVTLGITKDMISWCINTAKSTGSEILKPNEGGDVCDTSNTEVLKFVKCLTELENLYCPANYIVQSKSCDRNRQLMKKKLHKIIE